MPVVELCPICHGEKGAHVHEPAETCNFTPSVHHVFKPASHVLKPESK